MKKFFILNICIWLILSCSLDDSENNISGLEILPIATITFPEYFEYNEVYNINYSYNRPSNCYLFYNLYYVIDDNERTIAVINQILNNNFCEDNNEIETKTFEFHCTKEQGFYLFKIWLGEDENGEDQYEIYEIPIIN